MKSATSFALNRQVDVNDLSKPIDEDNLKVSQPASSVTVLLLLLLILPLVHVPSAA